MTNKSQPTVQPVKFHTLKTLAPFWDDVMAGVKPFEVRRNDRDFTLGDILILRRMRQDEPDLPDWDGDYMDIYKRVSYVLTGGQFGILPGYVVMAVADLTPAELRLAYEVQNVQA